ncbi:hypothetical protein PR048_026604 [Dryococelus australis]|uniref:Uncharacterized protein n=1 Tax=Dryococelus australis TaxID=614101 RepID=A0ABQ9GLT6_9NEOP|nr:hypothetical protein PR048_026604 [Dryococelus australis]
MSPVLSNNKMLGCACSDIAYSKEENKNVGEEMVSGMEKYSHMMLLQELDSEDFRNYLRMDHKSFSTLLDLVLPLMMKHDTVMREAERLVLTLRYLAIGRDYADLKYSTAISRQLLSEIISETCEAIYKVLRNYIQLRNNMTRYWVLLCVETVNYSGNGQNRYGMWQLNKVLAKIPATGKKWLETAYQSESMWQFTNCVGCMDRKHVLVNKPPGSGLLFYNYKGTFSIVLFAVVNANYEFM